MTHWLHLLRKRSEKFTTDKKRIDQWMEAAKNSVEEKGQKYVEETGRFIEISGKKVLDIGCGDGSISLAFAIGNAVVTGIDLDSTLIEVCNLRKKEYSVDVVFKKIDINDMGNSLQEKFNIILCVDVIEHIQSLQTLLNNMLNVLAKNGKIFIYTPNKFCLNNIIKDPHYKVFGLSLLSNKIAKSYIRCFYPKIKTYDVYKLYSNRELIHFFRNYNLTAVNMNKISLNDKIQKNEWMAAILNNRIIANLSSFIFKNFYIGTNKYLLERKDDKCN